MAHENITVKKDECKDARLCPKGEWNTIQHTKKWQKKNGKKKKFPEVKKGEKKDEKL